MNFLIFFAIKVKLVKLIFSQKVKILEVVILLFVLIHTDFLPSKDCALICYTYLLKKIRIQQIREVTFNQNCVRRNMSKLVAFFRRIFLKLV